MGLVPMSWLCFWASASPRCSDGAGSLLMTVVVLTGGRAVSAILPTASAQKNGAAARIQPAFWAARAANSARSARSFSRGSSLMVF